MKRSKMNIDSYNQLTKDNIASFSGSHEEVILEPETILHRLANHRYPFSDCWMNHETFVPFINGIQRSKNKRNERAKRNMALERLGIIAKWNPLTHRTKIEILKPIKAYKGTIGPQRFVYKADGTCYNNGSTGGELLELRHGGGEQYIIPFFKHPKFFSDASSYVRLALHQPLFKSTFGGLVKHPESR